MTSDRVFRENTKGSSPFSSWKSLEDCHLDLDDSGVFVRFIPDIFSSPIRILQKRSREKTLKHKRKMYPSAIVKKSTSLCHLKCTSEYLGPLRQVRYSLSSQGLLFWAVERQVSPLPYETEGNHLASSSWCPSLHRGIYGTAAQHLSANFFKLVPSCSGSFCSLAWPCVSRWSFAQVGAIHLCTSCYDCHSTGFPPGRPLILLLETVVQGFLVAESPSS